jgi:hypothetical protein
MNWPSAPRQLNKARRAGSSRICEERRRWYCHEAANFAVLFCISKSWGFAVTKYFLALLLTSSACVYGASAQAQDVPTGVTFGSSTDQAKPASDAKPAAKKSAHKDAAHAKQTPEEAEKAARIEEGRKKFFQRSMGFDNGKSSESPVTLQSDGAGGITPAVGMKF